MLQQYLAGCMDRPNHGDVTPYRLCGNEADIYISTTALEARHRNGSFTIKTQCRGMCALPGLSSWLAEDSEDQQLERLIWEHSLNNIHISEELEARLGQHVSLGQQMQHGELYVQELQLLLCHSIPRRACLKPPAAVSCCSSPSAYHQGHALSAMI